MPEQLKVPENLSFFSLPENTPLNREVSPIQKSETEEEDLPFHTYGGSSFMPKNLTTYKYFYICNKVISVLLLKSIVPKYEVISETEIAKPGCLGNEEGI